LNRFLLDTNVISDAIRASPSPQLRDWMMARADDELFTSALNIAEIERGILRLPAGKKRRGLETWFNGPTGPSRIFEGRILPFDEQAGSAWAKLMADGERQGNRRNPLDMIVAAIALVHDCVVVTQNERDFAELAFFNPLRDGTGEN
jgi:toxin FitB